MRHEDECALVRDLAPLYMEDLVSEETARVIREHLETCGECKEQYETLAAGMEQEEQKKEARERTEIDYMRKVRRYQRSNLALGGVVSFLLGFFGPCILLGISVIRNGGIAEYQLARLQLAWHILFWKMFLWGVAASGIYFLAGGLFLRRLACKKR